MSMVHTILLPLDGSPQAEAALCHAGALATRLGSRLLLVRAVHVRTLPGHDAADPRREECERARAYLHEVADIVLTRFPGLRVGVTVPLGRPEDAILDEAALERASLIVLGTHGASAWGSWGLGHVAEAVLRRAEVPVLLVRTGLGPHSAGRERRDAGHSPWLSQRVRVLVPLDGSATAEAALRFTAELGTQMATTATLLHVVSEAEAPGNVLSSELGAPETPLAPFRRSLAWERSASRLSWATAAAYCLRAVAWMGEHGIIARAEVRSGPLAEEVLRAAQGTSDVIVLGVCAPGRAAWWSFDSVASQLVRIAPCLILLVPSYATERVLPQPGTSSRGEHQVAGKHQVAGEVVEAERPPATVAPTSLPQAPVHANPLATVGAVEALDGTCISSPFLARGQRR